MKAKLLNEYLRARKQPGLRQGSSVSCDTSFEPHLLCFQTQSVGKKNVYYHCKTVSTLPKMRL